jgi:hypothetical protein
VGWPKDIWNLQWNLKGPFLGVVVVVIALAVTLTLVIATDGNGGDSTVGGPTQTPSPAPTPIESPTAPLPETITVMTYNILKGAGADTVDPGNKEQAAQHGFPGNRLPTVLEVIRIADPDILGIQEANQWNMGSPPVVEKVADELGMNHFLGLSTNSESGYASVVLFTKFDIK